jgi:hypothetical protein
MHPPRDLGAIGSDLCAVQDAFQLTRMCAARQKNAGVTREIKETIAKLDRDGVHIRPLSPFLFKYMGLNNHIFNGAASPDPFHVLCAGCLPALQSWVVRIIQLFHNNKHVTNVR